METPRETRGAAGQVAAAVFGDRMFALRCAAEDLGTAVAEGAGHDVLADLTDTLLELAREAEKLR